jgi:hypothetical protein
MLRYVVVDSRVAAELVVDSHSVKLDDSKLLQSETGQWKTSTRCSWLVVDSFVIKLEVWTPMQ